ncbi:MAG: hypothetical protein N3A66_10885, partial [Planctomycetota bacterium]|nr:hypothetical protein [Planctomycetota bacterium]
VSDVRLLGFDEFSVTLPQARQMILGRPYYGESVQIGAADRDAEYLRAGAGTAAGNTTAAGES